MDFLELKPKSAFAKKLIKSVLCLQKHFGALLGFRQEYLRILELGVLHVGLQNQVSRIGEGMEYFAELIPVDVPHIRKHTGVRSEIVRVFPRLIFSLRTLGVLKE